MSCYTSSGCLEGIKYAPFMDDSWILKSLTNLSKADFVSFGLKSHKAVGKKKVQKDQLLGWSSSLYI